MPDPSSRCPEPTSGSNRSDGGGGSPDGSRIGSKSGQLSKGASREATDSVYHALLGIGVNDSAAGRGTNDPDGAPRRRVSLELPPGPFGADIQRSAADGTCVVIGKTNESSPLLVGDVIESLNGTTLADVEGGMWAWVGLISESADDVRKVIVRRSAEARGAASDSSDDSIGSTDLEQESVERRTSETNQEGQVEVDEQGSQGEGQVREDGKQENHERCQSKDVKKEQEGSAGASTTTEAPISSGSKPDESQATPVADDDAYDEFLAFLQA